MPAQLSVLIPANALPERRAPLARRHAYEHDVRRHGNAGTMGRIPEEATDGEGQR